MSAPDAPDIGLTDDQLQNLWDAVHDPAVRAIGKLDKLTDAEFANALERAAQVVTSEVLQTLLDCAAERCRRANGGPI